MERGDLEEGLGGRCLEGDIAPFPFFSYNVVFFIYFFWISLLSLFLGFDYHFSRDVDRTFPIDVLT